MNKEQARYIQISFPFQEEHCSYIYPFEDEEDDEEQLPLVNMSYWQGTIDLQNHKLLDWESYFGECYLQAKVFDAGIYTLLDAEKKPISTL